ncbi:MAG: hypothetical protein N3A38_10595, partial [Planctomycetota bacterium]|nr:hypothetical protein [Planctomycetota bacterium]
MGQASAWRNVALLAAAVAICGGALVWRAARSGGGRPSGPERVAATSAAGGSAGVAADGGKEAGTAKGTPAAASLPDGLYVVPEGGDVPPGIPSAAVFRRIQDAVNAARPGSVIHLTKGIYREAIVFRKSGQPGRPITIEGETETVLDPSFPEPADAEWTPASEVASGVYKRALPERPGLLALEGKYILRLSPEAMEGDAFKAPGMGAELLAKAPLGDPASGGPEAVWGWRDGFVYI